MSIDLTILCENSVEKVSPVGLLGEHGFACHLRTEQGDYLFDTGGVQTLIANSTKLNINLQKLAAIILSHGHRDHSGGLQQVLAKTGEIPVYGHPELFDLRHSNNGPQRRPIGIPWPKASLEQQGAKFQLARQPQQMAKGLTLSGEIPRIHSIEKGDPNLEVTSATGQSHRDPVNDDNSLFIESPKGLIILLGCAHAGLLNIIDYACKITGHQKIHMLIGGTHLKYSQPQQLEATLKRLAEIDIDHIGVAHCTGFRPTQRLAACFGEKLFHASVGTKISI